MSGGLASAFGLDDGPFTEVLGGNANVSSKHTPTIVYGALAGEAYATQLLRPLSPASIFLLSQSGWSVERLLLCCIARVGDIDNARSASGPTPDVLPDNSAFRRLAAHLRTLQVDGGLIVQVIEDADGAPQVVMKWQRNSPAGEDVAASFERHKIARVSQLADGRLMAVLSIRGDASGDYSARGRSFLGILSALSQTVHVPGEHRAMTGQTRDTRPLTARMTYPQVSPACTPAAPWSEVTGNYFAVQYSAEPPKTAAVSIPYRGYWFYIDDRCRRAKSTLDLIGHLYALQASLSGADDSKALILLGG